MASESCKPSTSGIRKSCIPIIGSSIAKAIANPKRLSTVAERRLSTVAERRLSTATHINSKSTMNVANNNEIKDDELQSWYDWIGQRVVIGGMKVGTLRFFGKTQFAGGCWCGVELDEPVGKNNGVVDDVEYFSCEKNFGIFAPLARTKKILKTDSKDDLIPESKLSTSNCKNMFSKINAPKQDEEVHKARLPYYSVNINERRKRIVSERPQGVHCKSGTFPEQRTDFNMNQCSNYNESNNVINFSQVRIPERRESTPAINSIHKDSVEKILNRTVVIRKCEPKTYPDQNVTFDVLDSQNKNIINSNKGESTFVIDSHNMSHDNLPKASLARSNTEEDTHTSAELEESSLCILSQSQMQEFTLCCDSDSALTIKKRPEIRKMESCDDVNEIPEFEESKITDNTLCETSPNSVVKQNETFERDCANSVSCSSDELNKTVFFDSTYLNKTIPQSGSSAENECLFPSEQFNNSNTKNASKFSFDCSPLEDINLNVVPGACSTPISGTLDSSKFDKLPKISSTTSLGIISPNIGCTVSSAAFNETYNLVSKETNSSTPKLNVISKLLHDLDIVSEISGIDHVSHFDCLNSESAAIINCMPNNLAPEVYGSNTNKSTSNVALNINSTEKEHILLQTGLLNSPNLKMHETDDISNLNASNHFEEKKKLVATSSCHVEECGDHTSAVNLNFMSSHLNLSKVEELNNTLNTKTNSNDSAENATLKNEAKILSKTFTYNLLEQSSFQSALPSVLNVKTDIFCPSERNECVDFNLETIKEFSYQENHSDETLPSDTVSAVDDSETDVNLTFSRDSSVCSYQHSEATTAKQTESVFSEPPIKQKQSNKTINNIDIKGPVRQPKRNIVSKIKLMLEGKKNNAVANRENVNSKNKYQMSKNAVTSKVLSTSTDNKSKIKTEVTSRINTNLKTPRSAMPKPNSQSKFNEAKKSDIPRGSLASKTTVNIQRVSKSKSISVETNIEKDSRILSQLQNVDSVGSQINESKGLNKSRPRPTNTALSPGNKEKELPVKRGIAIYLRRNNTLPKAKQNSRLLFQRK